MFRMMFNAGLFFMILFLILSILFFVRNHVAKLIGDITGWNMWKIKKQLYKEREKKHLVSESNQVNIYDEADYNETMKLYEDRDATIVLTDYSVKERNWQEVTRETSFFLEIEEEIMVVHTDANIEVA